MRKAKGRSSRGPAHRAPGVGLFCVAVLRCEAGLRITWRRRWRGQASSGLCRRRPVQGSLGRWRLPLRVQPQQRCGLRSDARSTCSLEVLLVLGVLDREPIGELTSLSTSRTRSITPKTVSYTHLRAHETDSYLVCRLL